MSDVLQGLTNIPGVMGAALFGSGDECIEHQLSPPYEPIVMTGALSEIRQALSVLSYLEGADQWNALVLRFEAGYLVIRSAGGFVLMVLAQPTLNPAMLSVGFNIALQKLAKMPSVHVPAARTPAPTPQRAQTATPPPTPPPLPAATRQAPPPPPAARASGNGLPVATTSQPSGPLRDSSPAVGSAQSMSQSPSLAAGSSVLSSSDAVHIMPDAVDRDTMDKLLKALARHIGPFAKMIMKEELTRLGATHSTLEHTRYDELLGSLARRVTDPGKRREFVTEAERLHKRPGG